ncbi:hypothetical protein Tco_1506541 [Tanacetum coccineum]
MRKKVVYLKVSDKEKAKRSSGGENKDEENDVDKENDELRLHLTIVPDEEKEVDYEILDRKYPIKEWKTECLGARPQTDQAEHLEEINLNVNLDGNVPIQMIKMSFGMHNKIEACELRLHSSSGVHTLVTDIGLVIHMLVEKKYPLRKEVLKQMLKMKLESEEESTMALELIKFVKKILVELEPEEHKSWLVHKQTACGKDFLNPFMVDNLPKIVRFSTYLASVVKSWLVQDQTVHALASPKANELAILEQTTTVAEKTQLLLKKDRVYKFKKCYRLQRSIRLGTHKIVESIYWKRFGKEVGQLVIRLDKIQFNHTLFLVFLYEMVADSDVFCSRVLDQVAGYGYG